VRFDPESATFRNGFTDDAAAAADAARLGRVGVQVLNMSLGGYTEDGDPPPATSAVVRALAAKGVAVVAAAGNAATDVPFWPAAEDVVIGVAAVDRDGVRATFSNHGDWVDACSLGVGVRSTYVRGTLKLADGTQRVFKRTARWSGTSFAAPRVAGAIAALLAEGRASTGREAWELLKASAPKGPSGCGVFIS
jgi:subtilisin family serine protease